MRGRLAVSIALVVSCAWAASAFAGGAPAAAATRSVISPVVSGSIAGYTIGPEVVIAPEEAGRYKSFPTGVLCRDGSILVAYRDGLNHTEGGSIYLVRWKNGVWGTPAVLLPKVQGSPQWQACGLKRRPSDGRIFLYARTYSVTSTPYKSYNHVSFSDDDGVTWSAQTPVTDPPGFAHLSTVGEPTCQFVELGGEARSAGTTLLVTGYGFKDGTYVDGSTDELSAAVLQSTDGIRWTVRSWIGELGVDGGVGYNEAAMVRLADGRLLCTLRCSDGRLRLAWSSDDGRTWTDPVIDKSLDWGHGPTLAVLPSGAVLRTERYRGPSICGSVSSDDGKTFGPPILLKAYTYEGGYADVITDADGRVHVVYYADDADKTPYISEVVLTPQALVATALEPSRVWRGYQGDLELAVVGGGFFPGARVYVDRVARAGTVSADGGRVAAPLTSADVAAAGTLPVVVKNPPYSALATSATLRLTVAPETTAPALRIEGAGGWHRTPVVLTLSATDSQSGVRKVQSRLSGARGWTDGATCTVPVSTQGRVAVEARAVDWCGNTGHGRATVNIDTTPPSTRAGGGVTVRRNATAVLKYRVGEPAGLSPRAVVELRIARRDGTVVQTVRQGTVDVGRWLTCRFKATLAPGSYVWRVYATDLAGNQQSSASASTLVVR